ncbi:MAG: hypothetical protein AB7G93_15240 [Bdellovibrionales bacterium]
MAGRKKNARTASKKVQQNKLFPIPWEEVLQGTLYGPTIERELRAKEGLSDDLSILPPPGTKAFDRLTNKRQREALKWFKKQSARSKRS